LESMALFSLDMHLGFGSPGSLAQGPIASPLELIRFQPPSGWDLLNQFLKSSEVRTLPISCLLVAYYLGN